MEPQDMIPGVRVRLNCLIDDGCGPGAILGPIEAGSLGVCVPIDPDCTQEWFGIAWVRFDERKETLDEWDNTLHVGPDRSFFSYASIAADFDRIEAP